LNKREERRDKRRRELSLSLSLSLSRTKKETRSQKKMDPLLSFIILPFWFSCFIYIKEKRRARRKDMNNKK
jgi:hypothetical protein